MSSVFGDWEGDCLHEDVDIFGGWRRRSDEGIIAFLSDRVDFDTVQPGKLSLFICIITKVINPFEKAILAFRG